VSAATGLGMSSGAAAAPLTMALDADLIGWAEASRDSDSSGVNCALAYACIVGTSYIGLGQTPGCSSTAGVAFVGMPYTQNLHHPPDRKITRVFSVCYQVYSIFGCPAAYFSTI
jgi:hypothetical protein